MTQKCYLLTSPEKFQQERGNGSSNTDSPTPTGKNVSAILKKKEDSTYSWEIPRVQPLAKDDSSTKTEEEKNGSQGVDVTTQLNAFHWPFPPQCRC